MGLIKRFNLDKMIEDYKTTVFFETGTFWGDGVAYALQSSFERIISVEIVPDIAKKAADRFAANKQVKIVEAESTAAMEKELGQISDNCVFWLDAHFPGADAGMKEYNADMDEGVRLPLVHESAIIHRLRKGKRDVIIMDDLRIYEDGPFTNGNVPADALPKEDRNIDFVYKYFNATHSVHKLYQEEGYILLLPKPGWWSFGKKKEAEYYLHDLPSSNAPLAAKEEPVLRVV